MDVHAGGDEAEGGDGGVDLGQCSLAWVIECGDSESVGFGMREGGVGSLTGMRREWRWGFLVFWGVACGVWGLSLYGRIL